MKNRQLGFLMILILALQFTVRSAMAQTEAEDCLQADKTLSEVPDAMSPKAKDNVYAAIRALNLVPNSGVSREKSQAIACRRASSPASMEASALSADGKPVSSYTDIPPEMLGGASHPVGEQARPAGTTK